MLSFTNEAFCQRAMTIFVDRNRYFWYISTPYIFIRIQPPESYLIYNAEIYFKGTTANLKRVTAPSNRADFISRTEMQICNEKQQFCGVSEKKKKNEITSPQGKRMTHIIRQRVVLSNATNECYEKRNKIRTSTVGIDIDSIRELKVVQLLQRLFDKSFDVQAGTV